MGIIHVKIVKSLDTWIAQFGLWGLMLELNP